MHWVHLHGINRWKSGQATQWVLLYSQCKAERNVFVTPQKRVINHPAKHPNILKITKCEEKIGDLKNVNCEGERKACWEGADWQLSHNRLDSPCRRLWGVALGVDLIEPHRQGNESQHTFSHFTSVSPFCARLHCGLVYPKERNPLESEVLLLAFLHGVTICWHIHSWEDIVLTYTPTLKLPKPLLL